MKKNRVVLRSIAFLVAGTIIALTILISPDSFSFFKKQFDNPNGPVRAASKEDIIDTIEVYYDGDQPMLKLKKAEDFKDYSPVVFFSIEGDLKDYILHVNPVKLEKGKETDECIEYNIPIIPNVNVRQAMNLLREGIRDLDDEVTGYIKVKHLNEFIDEPVEIGISKRYLIKCSLMDDKNNQLAGINKLDISETENEELMKYISEVIDSSTDYIDWKEVEWETPIYTQAQGGYYSLPIGRIELSSKQSDIVDQVAPKLLDYNDSLYDILEDLADGFNKKVDENNELRAQNERLIEEKIALEEQNAALCSYISSLENQITTLSTQSKQEAEPSNSDTEKEETEPLEESKEDEESKKDKETEEQ